MLFLCMARDLNRISWWQVLLILAVPLVIFFYRGFQSELVLFANDGTLGNISTEAGSLPGSFAGYWDDVYWVGQERPSATLNFTQLLGWAANSSVIYSKVRVPMALLLLGFAGWVLFRQLGFRPVVCVLGALAFVLNMNVFSNACWGLASWTVALASVLMALAALHLKPARMPFLKYVLAGFAVGHGVMEGYDVGALYSLVVGGYAAFRVLAGKGGMGGKGLKAAGLVLLMAVSSAVFATQALSTLIGTQVQGVAGMAQTQEAKKQRWDEATQWSLPKLELLRAGIPGLFGYRMTDMEGKVQKSSYWGAVGRSPGWETNRQGLARHSGSGEYAGVLVLVLAAFAVFQSFRGSRTPFDRRQRAIVWFWTAVAILSVLLAFGRHGPLYRLVYDWVPYFSTIRNPIKFMHLFHLATVILFGYGMQILWTHYLERATERKEKLGKFIKRRLAGGIAGFEQVWMFASAAAVFYGGLLCLVYASSKREMVRFLSGVKMPGELAGAIHTFSVGELVWSMVFLSIVLILVALAISGAFCWKHGKALGIALGLLLLVDLGRADRFWIQYYDYKEKYASNPIIDKLRENSFEHRVSSTLNPYKQNWLASPDNHGPFFRWTVNSWLQHQFPFYNIRSLDVVQMPRTPIIDKTFGEMFAAGSQYVRLWELTSTCYLLGMTNYLAILNQQFDLGRNRFKLLSRFDFVPKQRGGSMTAVERPQGRFGIFEFEGALPKTKRYASWTVITNEQSVLHQLADLRFDPMKTVVVMDKTVKPPAAVAGENNGTAVIESYHPKRIKINTAGSRAGVLLYNDRYHPHWNVYVDGEQRPLLRCNYIMRGVQVPAGKRVVEFRYEPPQWGLAISLASIALGVWILYLCLAGNKRKVAGAAVSDAPKN